MSTRACETCTACCTVMAVTEIAKPAYTPCVNCNKQGCSVYATRPSACAGYSCLWLIDEGNVLKDVERPDKSGLVFEMSGVHRDLSPFEKATGLAFLVAREAFPGAFEAYRGAKLLKRLSQKTLIILARENGTRSAIGPPEKLRTFLAYSEHVRTNRIVSGL